MDHLNTVEPGCVGTIVGGYVCSCSCKLPLAFLGSNSVGTVAGSPPAMTSILCSRMAMQCLPRVSAHA